MWEAGEIAPNCSNRFCMASSDVEIDDVPYCLDCADQLLDRFCAVSLRPELREMLPELWRA